MSPPICKNCTHFSTRSISFRQHENDLYKCNAPQNIIGVGLVLGEPILQNIYCTTARVNNGVYSCGEEGRWFSPASPSTGVSSVNKGLVTKSKSPAGNL